MGIDRVCGNISGTAGILGIAYLDGADKVEDRGIATLRPGGHVKSIARGLLVTQIYFDSEKTYR